MASYNVARAKDGLSGLIDKAIKGEEVVITRRGQPVVELRAVSARSDQPGVGTHAWIKARRDARPSVNITSVDLIRQMRDEGL